MNGFIETLKAQDEKEQERKQTSLIFFIIAANIIWRCFFASIITTDKTNPMKRRLSWYFYQ